MPLTREICDEVSYFTSLERERLSLHHPCINKYYSQLLQIVIITILKYIKKFCCKIRLFYFEGCSNEEY